MVVSNQKNNDFTSLRQDMAKVEILVDRLDTAIVKLTEVSSGVSQLLAVHESKLITQESVLKQIADMVETRRLETEEKIKNIQSRISSGEKDLSDKIDTQIDKVMAELREMRKESTAQHEKLSGRITFMEKWMWIVIGGSVVVGFILQTIPWKSII